MISLLWYHKAFPICRLRGWACCVHVQIMWNFPSGSCLPLSYIGKGLVATFLDPRLFSARCGSEWISVEDTFVNCARGSARQGRYTGDDYSLGMDKDLMSSLLKPSQSYYQISGTSWISTTLVVCREAPESALRLYICLKRYWFADACRSRPLMQSIHRCTRGFVARSAKCGSHVYASQNTGNGSTWPAEKHSDRWITGRASWSRWSHYESRRNDRTLPWAARRQLQEPRCISTLWETTLETTMKTIKHHVTLQCVLRSCWKFQLRSEWSRSPEPIVFRALRYSLWLLACAHEWRAPTIKATRLAHEMNSLASSFL